MNPKEEKSNYKVEPVTNCDRLDMPVRIESLIHIIRDQQVMLDSETTEDKNNNSVWQRS